MNKIVIIATMLFLLGCNNPCDIILPTGVSMVFGESHSIAENVYRRAGYPTDKWEAWDAWMDTSSILMRSKPAYTSSSYYMLALDWADTGFLEIRWFNGEKFTDSYFDVYKAADSCELKRIYFNQSQQQ